PQPNVPDAVPTGRRSHNPLLLLGARSIVRSTEENLAPCPSPCRGGEPSSPPSLLGKGAGLSGAALAERILAGSSPPSLLGKGDGGSLRGGGPFLIPIRPPRRGRRGRRGRRADSRGASRRRSPGRRPSRSPCAPPSPPRAASAGPCCVWDRAHTP